jgi:hypothetical protein
MNNTMKDGGPLVLYDANLKTNQKLFNFTKKRKWGVFMQESKDLNQGTTKQDQSGCKLKVNSAHQFNDQINHQQAQTSFTLGHPSDIAPTSTLFPAKRSKADHNRHLQSLNHLHRHPTAREVFPNSQLLDGQHQPTNPMTAAFPSDPQTVHFLSTSRL